MAGIWNSRRNRHDDTGRYRENDICGGKHETIRGKYHHRLPHCFQHIAADVPCILISVLCDVSGQRHHRYDRRNGRKKNELRQRVRFTVCHHCRRCLSRVRLAQTIAGNRISGTGFDMDRCHRRDKNSKYRMGVHSSKKVHCQTYHYEQDHRCSTVSAAIDVQAGRNTILCHCGVLYRNRCCHTRGILYQKRNPSLTFLCCKIQNKGQGVNPAARAVIALWGVVTALRSAFAARCAGRGSAPPAVLRRRFRIPDGRQSPSL